MASGDKLFDFGALDALGPPWVYVKFTSGSTEPTLGDTIWGDTSDANAVLQYLELVSGTWAGNDAAGWMILDNWNGTTWSSGENFTANTTTAGNHGTLTLTPTDPTIATLDRANGTWVLDFDADSNEVALFQGVCRGYGGGGLTATLGVSSSVNTLDMSWYLFIKTISDDVDNLTNVGADPSGLKVFAAPQKNEAFDAPSAVGEVAMDVITFTDGGQVDNLADGDLTFFLLVRNAQDAANDDMAADGALHFLEVRET